MMDENKDIQKKENINSVIKRDKKTPNNLTFFEHAEELRIRLFIGILFIIAFFVFYFIFSKNIMQYLIAPLRDLGYDLNFYKVHEAFFSTLKISFFSALITALPVLLILLIGFILPALPKLKEKIMLFIMLVFSIVFLISGFIFSYKLLIPLSLNYLLSFSKGEINSVISIGFYLDYFLILFFATGVGFQLPLIMLFINKLGILDYKLLSKGRKFAVIIILILSAVITPPDIISQVFLGVPLLLLYEFGLFLILIFNKKKKKK